VFRVLGDFQHPFLCKRCEQDGRVSLVVCRLPGVGARRRQADAAARFSGTGGRQDIVADYVILYFWPAIPMTVANKSWG